MVFRPEEVVFKSINPNLNPVNDKIGNEVVFSLVIEVQALEQKAKNMRKK